MKYLIPALALLVASTALTAGHPKASEMFMKQFDADNDGIVSRDEFVAPHLQGINQQFDQMDMNRDGKVDAGEADAFAETMRKRMEEARKMHRKGRD